MKSTEPFMFALALSLYHWSYVKNRKMLVLQSRKYIVFVDLTKIYEKNVACI